MTAEALQLPGVGELVADGRFELLGQLGEGGMSTVFIAADHVLGREVALKLLTARYVGRSEREQRLINEAEYLRRVQGHPNVIEFIDAGRLNDRSGWPWLATEIMRGEDLDWLFIRGKVEIPQVVSIARQIASALAACHEAGIVHRDVTPSNVFLLDDERTVKLFDFSHAADLSAAKVVAGASERLTGVFETPGTLGYMGPEQVVNAPPDTSMDAFGFGVLLFRMVTGRDPYRQFSDRDAFIKAQREGALEQPRLHAWAYDAPDELADLVHDCTQRDGEQRPTMLDIVARLDALAAPAAPALAPTAPALTPAAPTPAPAPATPALTPAAPVLAPTAPPAQDVTSVELPFARPPHLREASVELEPVAVLDEPPPSPEAERDQDADPEASTVATLPRPRAPIVVAVLLALGLLSAVAWIAFDLGRRDTEREPEPELATLPQPLEGEQPDLARDPDVARDTDEAIVETDTGPQYEAVPQIEGVTEPKPKPKPKPQAPDPTCEGIEADARTATQRRQWATVIELTERKRCWSSNNERTRLRVNALLLSRRNAECVKAGRGSRDPQVLSMVKTCEALLDRPTP